MNYQILKHNDGRMLAVVWPEEPKIPKVFDQNDANLMVDFQKACKQAIANAVPFKNQKDEQELKLKLTKQQFPIDSHIDVSKLEHLKPYDVPEGIEIEILSANGENIKHGNLFAFIKAKEEVESQSKILNDLLSLQSQYVPDGVHYDGQRNDFIEKAKSKFRIERIK